MCRRVNSLLPLLPALAFSAADQFSIVVPLAHLADFSSEPERRARMPAARGRSIQHARRWVALAVQVVRDNGLALDSDPVLAERGRDLADLAPGRGALLLHPLRRAARNALPHADADADSNSIRRPRTAR